MDQAELNHAVALREREFRLYKDIRIEFRRRVRVQDLMMYLSCLTEADEVCYKTP